MIDPFAAYDMTGKVAVLTGGASGIGEASAELIAGAGGAVVLGDIDEAGAEKVAQRICDAGGRAVAQRCNVADKADVDALVDRAVAEFGRVDAMGNIAGIMNADLVINITEAEFDRIVGINMKGVFQAQQPVDAKAAVIGWFKNEKQSYMVKPENDEVRAKLLQFNGKTIMVFAKERNRGKYLIVMGIVEEPDGTTPKRKKKGF